MTKAQSLKASWSSISHFAIRNINLCPSICPYDGFQLSAVWYKFLKKFPSLRSYFVSGDLRDKRFRRSNDWFSNPLLEQALLFSCLQCTISIFTNYNLLLQHEEPTIHLVKSSMEALARKLAARIIKPVVLRNVSSVKEIGLSDDNIFIAVKSIFVDGTTKAKLDRLLKEGDITQDQYNRFHEGA